MVGRGPAGPRISGIAVIPPSGEYPVGEFIKPRLLVAYSDGTALQRYVRADNLIAASSTPNVVNLSDPVAWELAAPGRATMPLTHRGFTTTSTLINAGA